MKEDRSILDSITDEARDLQRKVGASRSFAARRLPRSRPRDRAPHPADGSAELEARADASTRPSACRTPSRATRR